MAWRNVLGHLDGAADLEGYVDRYSPTLAE
jgi:hypothetical protein